MLRLLGIGATLALASLLFTATEGAPSARAAPLEIFIYIYHPTGGSSTQAELNCGWHDNCDGIFGDPRTGLDWGYAAGDTKAWGRLRVIGTSAATIVARGYTYQTEYNTCPGVSNDLKRFDDFGLIGNVRHNHTFKGGGTSYHNIYARNSPAYDNSWPAGYFITGYDPCSSYSHVMQWYIAGPYSNIVTDGNPNIPDEPAYFHCDTLYDEWTLAERIVSFTDP
jgi:hypothetical protein